MSSTPAFPSLLQVNTRIWMRELAASLGYADDEGWSEAVFAAIEARNWSEAAARLGYSVRVQGTGETGFTFRQSDGTFRVRASGGRIEIAVDVVLGGGDEPPLHAVAPLRHVTLLQGTKAYGAHLHPIPIPARERAPRDRVGKQRGDLRILGVTTTPPEIMV